MKNVIVVTSALSALFVLAGISAVPASADICAISSENVGNYKKRVPDNATGACQEPGKVGKERYIIIKTKGVKIGPGTDCAEVSEASTGNFKNSTCTEKVTEGSGSFIKIEVSCGGEVLVDTKRPVSVPAQLVALFASTQPSASSIFSLGLAV